GGTMLRKTSLKLTLISYFFCSLLVGGQVRGSESKLNETINPILESNKDIKLNLGALVLTDKVRQSYKSQIGLNFNEEGSFEVNGILIKLKPIRRNNEIQIALELHNLFTGALIKESTV